MEKTEKEFLKKAKLNFRYTVNCTAIYIVEHVEEYLETIPRTYVDRGEQMKSSSFFVILLCFAIFLSLSSCKIKIALIKIILASPKTTAVAMIPIYFPVVAF